MSEDAPKSLHHIRGSVILLSLRVFAVLFFVDTVFAILLAIAQFMIGSDYYNFVIASLWFLHTIKFVLEIYMVLAYVLPWATTTYYINNSQLIKCTGIIKVDEKVYELSKLRAVDLTASWLGKLLDYGTIRGTVSASGYTDEFLLVGIADAKKYERILHAYLSEAGQTR